MRNFLLAIVLQFVLTSCSAISGGELPQPDKLTISEGFVDPIGYYDSEPSFSWVLPQDCDIKSQSAYSIVVASNPDLLPDNADIWSTGKVVTDQSLDVEYAGRPLKSREQIYWQVRYWDEQDRQSKWSDVATCELGLLGADEWSAEWIKLEDPKEWEKTKYKTPLFRPTYMRQEFNVDSKIKKARLYITAKGIFEAHINGKKVGNDVLTPGWTPYSKRIETLTYDVTSYITVKDENAIALILAEGWHSGRFGPQRRWASVTTPPSIICQLEIETVDGERQTIVTDNSWKATNKGAIRSAGLYDGEVYDANYELTGWDAPSYDDSAWSKVVAQSVDKNVELSPKQHAPIRDKREVKPVNMTIKGESKVLYDLGQNMVGVVEINMSVNKGDTIKLRHGEMLTKEGALFTKNLSAAPSIDYYIAKEDGTISWRPTFTFHGFRYVEVSGYDKQNEPKGSWVTGVVQYSDFDMGGYFNSSIPKLNQLHSNIQWGLRGNFMDVPLDCPQRSERLGWTGDAQVFIPTSMYLADTHAFWSAWLKSMREEQFDNGGIPVVVPNFTGDFAQAGWSDACVVIPYELYKRTGDKSVLRDNYAMMQRWCEYHDSEATDFISHMWTVGDWLQPHSQQEDTRRGDAPNDLISTAYYARAIEFTMRTAEVLGYTEDSARYKKTWESIRKAFEAEYFESDGSMKPQYITAQTNYLLALGFDLLSDDVASGAIEKLVELIRDADTHLRTGFIGTPLLAYVLDSYGKSDVLYEVLLQESYPSQRSHIVVAP